MTCTPPARATTPATLSAPVEPKRRPHKSAPVAGTEATTKTSFVAPLTSAFTRTLDATGKETDANVPTVKARG